MFCTFVFMLFCVLLNVQFYYILLINIFHAFHVGNSYCGICGYVDTLCKLCPTAFSLLNIVDNVDKPVDKSVNIFVDKLIVDKCGYVDTVDLRFRAFS